MMSKSCERNMGKESLEDPALDVLVTYRKKSQTEKTSIVYHPKEEETDGHQTSQVQ